MKNTEILQKIHAFFRSYSLWILLVIYAVGTIGIGGYDKLAFARATPWVLLLSTVLIVLSHSGTWKAIGLFFGITFILGFLVELVGIHTGFPFGSYTYGPTLGVKVAEVPLVIGVNWFLLSVSAAYAIRYIFDSKVMHILGAALLMVFTDFWIEPVAQSLDFWEWEGRFVPLVNFIGWFAVSLVMQMAFHLTVKKEPNSLAAAYYVIVTLFFIILNILL